MPSPGTPLTWGDGRSRKYIANGTAEGAMPAAQWLSEAIGAGAQGHGDEKPDPYCGGTEESYLRNTEVRPILSSIAARDIRQPADSK